MSLNKGFCNRRHGLLFQSLSFKVILLVFIMFIMIFFSVRARALTGISGKVYKYPSTTSTLSNINVLAFSEDNSNVAAGSATTSSDGSYTISLSAGNYRVCASGKDYVAECYESGCSGSGCGFYLVADPNEIIANLVHVENGQITGNINFHLCYGGQIEGDIYNVIEGIAYNVVVEGTVTYKGKTAVSVPNFDVSVVDEHYSTNAKLPPGDYTIRIEDASVDYPYYHVIYYNEKYTEDQADVLEFQLDQAQTYTIDFHLQKGAIVYGDVTILETGEYVSEARVSLTEQNSGYSRYARTVESYTDPNGEFVLTRGMFLITGLPPGSYIFKTDDLYFPEDNKIYLTEYYDSVYMEDLATPISLSAGEEREINGTLARAPNISGWVIKGDPNQCVQYDPEKALGGMEIEIKPYPWQIEPVYTDPNGFYVMGSVKKILPGTYNIIAKEPSPPYSYYFTTYKDITLEPDMEYPLNFCLKEAIGDISGRISGYVFYNEDPNLPISDVKVAALEETYSNFYNTTTQMDGKYVIDIEEPGNYVVFTAEVLNDGYPNLTLELYKDICILNDEVFEEGSEVVEQIMELAEMVSIPPGEHVTGVNFGLSAYRYTFGPGLNLFGYPGIPVSKYNDSHKFCAELGQNMRTFRWKEPATSHWQITLPNPSNPSEPLGDKIQIMTGSGYLIYMDHQAGPVFYPPYKVQPPLSYQLGVGDNFIAYPSSWHRPIRRSYDLLSAIGTQDNVANVKSFENISGKWLSSVWMWGRPGGTDFSIIQGGSYLVGMRAPVNFIPVSD